MHFQSKLAPVSGIFAIFAHRFILQRWENLAGKTNFR